MFIKTKGDFNLIGITLAEEEEAAQSVTIMVHFIYGKVNIKYKYSSKIKYITTMYFHTHLAWKLEYINMLFSKKLCLFNEMILEKLIRSTLSSHFSQQKAMVVI